MRVSVGLDGNLLLAVAARQLEKHDGSCFWVCLLRSFHTLWGSFFFQKSHYSSCFLCTSCLIQHLVPHFSSSYLSLAIAHSRSPNAHRAQRAKLFSRPPEEQERARHKQASCSLPPPSLYPLLLIPLQHLPSFLPTSYLQIRQRRRQQVPSLPPSLSATVGEGEQSSKSAVTHSPFFPLAGWLREKQERVEA